MTEVKNPLCAQVEEDCWKRRRSEQDRILLLQRINYERFCKIKDTYERITKGLPLDDAS